MFSRSFYSETGEDVVIKQFIDKTPGKYIDVGAYHPILGSNTYDLYLKKWSGIAVEPQQQHNKLWKYFRKRDLVINLPVSSKKNVLFHYSTNPLLSTTNEFVADFHRSEEKWSHSETLETLRLESILPKQLSPFENFLLSIDIEGSELDALTTIDWKNQKPRVVLIESWSKPWLDGSTISHYMSKKDYSLEAYTGLTSVYVAKEFLKSKTSLKERLSEEFKDEIK
jgi:FkbM family methyltransferase